MPDIPLTVPEAFTRAIATYQRRSYVEAERLCVAILGVDPGHFDALRLCGVVQHNRGLLSEALASYDKALAIAPNHPETLCNRGSVLANLNRQQEALTSYDAALAVAPDYVDAHYNRGLTLKALKRHDEALSSYDKVLAIAPGHADALNDRGNVLRELQRFEEALISYDRAVARRAAFAEAFNNRGVVLQELSRFEEALASFDTALALRPDYVDALTNRGVTLKDQKRYADALASFDRALAIRPDDVDALNGRGNTLREMRRFAEALESFERAVTLKPDHEYALSGLADCALQLCDWTRQDALSAELRRRACAGPSIITPLIVLAYADDAAVQLAAARRYAASRIRVAPQPLWRGETWRNDRIKLAYLSADFCQHPVAQLTVELFERHDRSRFEVIGISLGPNDRSDLRARLVRAFDQFHDAHMAGDHEVAAMLHERRADILIDLTGYTLGCRPRILAQRATPIAAAYLGFPGTMGADFVDYIIADRIILPFDRQDHFSEKIVHLPHSFQANASLAPSTAAAPIRRDAGLPDTGFVFCCFNTHHKITATVFDIWMRLLGAVEGSVLWLSRAGDGTTANLRHAAAARSIDPARLIFAPRTARFEDHLARHRAADLFLDTLPYNAHTTASDALRSGLPVLTCRGQTLVARVAASLLDTVGLPELVTHNHADYEALALRLATDPVYLADIKARLERNLPISPLFDADRFRRHIEAAYTTMWEIWQRGENPRGFSVVP